MLDDPREIEIIASARQKQVADPRRPRVPFERILADFLADICWEGRVLLDLGPGQYDFGELARARGAVVHNIDHDPAVVALGKYKGFAVRQANLKHLRATDYPWPFDGVFCKFSINAFWFHADRQQHTAYLQQLAALLKPDGWAWIAPWNGIPRKAQLSTDQIKEVLAVQARTLGQLGFEGRELSDEWCCYYGIHGHTANAPIFVRNLSWPARLQHCPAI